MNAKRDDLSRLQEIHDIILQTKRQLRARVHSFSILRS